MLHKYFHLRIPLVTKTPEEPVYFLCSHHLFCTHQTKEGNEIVLEQQRSEAKANCSSFSCPEQWKFWHLHYLKTLKTLTYYHCI